MNLDQSYITIESTLIQDLAPNPNAVVPIVDGQALQVSSFRSGVEGISFLDRAKNILDRFQALQLSGVAAVDNGGFYDAYVISNGNPAPASGTSVTTGNNAWLLMAINYYTIFSGDAQFIPMAVELGKMLQARQIVNPSTSNFGGIFSRSTLTTTFVAEHQADAYSGLFYLAQMEGISTSDANSFRESAARVKTFIGVNLYNPTSMRFSAANHFSIGNTSSDAQTSIFLSLPGQTISDGSNEFEVASALNFVFDNNNLFRSENYFDRIISGVTFREDDPDFNSGRIQHVWIEGSGQMALALGVLDGLGLANNIDMANRTNLITKIEKIRHPSGGYPTFL